eukprot:EG_transcript_6611
MSSVHRSPAALPEYWEPERRVGPRGRLLPSSFTRPVEAYDSYATPYSRYLGRSVADGYSVTRGAYPSSSIVRPAGGYYADDYVVPRRAYPGSYIASRPGSYAADGYTVTRQAYPSSSIIRPAGSYYADEYVTRSVYPGSRIVGSYSELRTGPGTISEGELQQRFREQHPYMFKPDGTLKGIEELTTACTELDSLIKSGLSISAAASTLTNTYSAKGATAPVQSTEAPQVLPEQQQWAQHAPPVEAWAQGGAFPVAPQPSADAWAEQPPTQWTPQPPAPVVAQPLQPLVDQSLVDQWAAQAPAQVPSQWVPQAPAAPAGQWPQVNATQWVGADAWASQPEQQWIAPAAPSVPAPAQAFSIQKAAPQVAAQVPLPPMDTPDEEPPAVPAAPAVVAAPAAVPEAPAAVPQPAAAPAPAAAPEERPSTRGGGFDLERSKRIAEQLLAS